MANVAGRILDTYCERRKPMLRGFLIATVVCLTAAGLANAVTVWTDNFDSYAAGSYLNGQGGWTDTAGANNYQFVAAGVAGTVGVNQGSGSQQLNWTGHSWSWGTDVAVGNKVVARMDFQANGSGQFDDDRVGWVLTSNPASSSYHFGTQLDTTDGGLVTYFRDNSGGNVKNVVISSAGLGTIAANGWYREELTVTKLTSGLGAGGARLDVSFQALDGSGNLVGSPLTASYGTIDTSAWRGFGGTAYPMFKNYSALTGNADNAYFAIVPEPATMMLLAFGGMMLTRRR
jgi:hypothetical protein